MQIGGALWLSRLDSELFVFFFVLNETHNTAVHDLDIDIGLLPMFRLVLEPFQFTIDSVLVKRSPACGIVVLHKHLPGVIDCSIGLGLTFKLVISSSRHVGQCCVDVRDT
jgi:hypothetical protein